MLTRSWGSCRTITTLIERTRNAEVRTRNRGGGFERRSRALDWPGGSAFRVPPSAFRLSSDQLQHSHPLRILPVAAQVNPPVAAAPDELPPPAQAARQHFVDDEVEADLPADVGALPLRLGERERDAIPLRRAPATRRGPGPRGPRGIPPSLRSPCLGSRAAARPSGCCPARCRARAAGRRAGGSKARAWSHPPRDTGTRRPKPRTPARRDRRARHTAPRCGDT